MTTPVHEQLNALARVVALATAWATQPTDWDEDTEQQIQDGRAILAAINGTPDPLKEAL